MKTSKLIIAATLILGTSSAFAQTNAPSLAINSRTYSTAIGLRAGETSGLTIKQFIGSNSALEGIIGIWGNGISATLLYEHHTTAFNVSGLNWYYGAGGHVSGTNNHYYYHHDKHRHDLYENGSVGIGVDGVFGLEYKIPQTPIAMSLDVKPYIEIITTGGVWTSLDPGLGIKVAF